MSARAESTADETLRRTKSAEVLERTKLQDLPVEMQRHSRQQRYLAKQSLSSTNTTSNKNNRSTTSIISNESFTLQGNLSSNTTDVCKLPESSLTAALVIVGYNIFLSITLSPVGFITLFLVDYCKCCKSSKTNSQVAPDNEKAQPSDCEVPPQVVMTVSNSDGQETMAKNKERELEKVWPIGISEYYQSAANLLYQIGYRGVFVFIQIRSANFVNPALFAIDLTMAAYFGARKLYCPGCLYNDMHVLLYKKKFDHVSVAGLSHCEFIFCIYTLAALCAPWSLCPWWKIMLSLLRREWGGSVSKETWRFLSIPQEFPANDNEINGFLKFSITMAGRPLQSLSNQLAVRSGRGGSTLVAEVASDTLLLQAPIRMRVSPLGLEKAGPGPGLTGRA
jgi:hypothetical protein